MNRINLRMMMGTIVSGLLFASAGFGQEAANFARYNPDGQKYSFVKTYLIGLSYLKLNDERSLETQNESFSELEDAKRTAVLMDNLILDNVNLRIARNLVRKFDRSDNGLILKVVDTFKAACNAQVDINNEERQLLQGLYDYQLSEKDSKYDFAAFRGEQERLASRRRNALSSLLEASTLVTKVLISGRADLYGDFSRLGLTGKERQKLTSKVDSLFGRQQALTVRAGQSFLEGSVAAIRETLLDGSLKDLDE